MSIPSAHSALICKIFARWGLLLAAFNFQILKALPIGFRYNQGDKVFLETKSQNFYLYHDEKAQSEARFTLQVLEKSKPILENWMQINRSESPLVVNLSAHSDNASFANFIFDNIELQTLGQGTRDLAWHEYVHSTMYRHFDTFLGPAGSILNLPWMSAWMIEGLAEALSVSVGSDIQAGIERYHAFTQNWPTFDHLHSLYASEDFFLSGYATSGAFVRFLFQDPKADLAVFLRDFTAKSRPWMWPATVVPFVDFMPEDSALKKQFNQNNGEKLYELYKKTATQKWQANISQSFFSQPAAGRLHYPKIPIIRYLDNKLTHVQSLDKKFSLQEIIFDSASQFANHENKITEYGKSFSTTGLNSRPQGKIFIKNNLIDHRGTSQAFLIINKNQMHKKHALNSQYAYRLTQNDNFLFWIEQDFEVTRFCYTAKNLFAKKCLLTKKNPDSIDIISRFQSKEIFIKLKHQTGLGDTYEIFKFSKDILAPVLWKNFGEPLQVIENKNSLFVLTAEKNYRVLKKINNTTYNCERQTTFVDLPLQLEPMEENHWAAVLFDGTSFAVRKFPMASLKFETCSLGSRHDSPLLAASRFQENKAQKLTLAEAISQGGIWSDETAKQLPEENKETLARTTSLATPHHWRAKPAFIFPWIGADDALGPQMGFISVPLIDHLQNEMLRVSALVGINSRYPNTDVSLSSTRFYPTVNGSFYRAQTYNGRIYNNNTQLYESSYLDEKGFHADANYPIYFQNSTLSFNLGMRLANLKPYIGEDVSSGNINEPYSSVNFTWNFSRWSWSNSLSARTTSKSFNSDFEYDIIAASTSVNYNIFKFTSNLNLRLDTSRTRGQKRRDVQEIYYPLKTFLAGTGGGYNKNNFPIVSAGSLFSPRFGDTQTRSQLQYIHPLIRSIDKFFWILYLDRLDFTMFYNYGGAWFDGDSDRGFSKSQLSAAQGYNLDFIFDNKGVRFNVGLGAGQVFGENFNAYFTSGFDAVF